eukprot:1158731-Pelagomonas_calceolata.AAC.12
MMLLIAKFNRFWESYAATGRVVASKVDTLFKLSDSLTNVTIIKLSGKMLRKSAPLKFSPSCDVAGVGYRIQISKHKWLRECPA